MSQKRTQLRVLYEASFLEDLAEKIQTVASQRYFFKQCKLKEFPEQIKDRNYTVIICQVSELLEIESQLRALAQDHCKLLLIVEDESQLTADILSLPFLSDYFVNHPSNERLLFVLNKLYSSFFSESEVSRLSSTINMQRRRLDQINKIGAALSTERSLNALLDKILDGSMELTASDSGSLYLVEQKPDVPEDDGNLLASKQLRFKLTRNLSIEFPFKESTMDINERSMAGFVALSDSALNIPDVYHIPTEAPYQFNKFFDDNAGYRTKSMMVVPMRNPNGDVVGVIQIINKKKHYTEPLPLSDEKLLEQEILAYNEDDVALLTSLAAQAAVAIENARLYESIQELFEGFIKASVQAIESRDPTTSGHSERVATLTVGLAEHVDMSSANNFAHYKFSREDLREIKYASLLHDFGKIGVREDVLVKAKKLYPYELEAVRGRFRYVREALINEYSSQKIQYILDSSREDALEHFGSIDSELNEKIQEVDEYLQFILKANEPTVLEQGGFERLHEIGDTIFKFHDSRIALLEPFEINKLSIKRGTLNEEERLEIESHVTHTFRFLSQIPWTTGLKRVPEIAYAHHEKLNGQGYPRNLVAANIPIQSKMMTIADIYDALTASDRPYKKALPMSRALDILGYEVKDGKLDPELYTLFKEAKIYERIGHSAS